MKPCVCQKLEGCAFDGAGKSRSGGLGAWDRKVHQGCFSHGHQQRGRKGTRHQVTSLLGLEFLHVINVREERDGSGQFSDTERMYSHNGVKMQTLLEQDFQVGTGKQKHFLLKEMCKAVNMCSKIGKDQKLWNMKMPHPSYVHIQAYVTPGFEQFHPLLHGFHQSWFPISLQATDRSLKDDEFFLFSATDSRLTVSVDYTLRSLHFPTNGAFQRGLECCQQDLVSTLKSAGLKGGERTDETRAVQMEGSPASILSSVNGHVSTQTQRSTQITALAVKKGWKNDCIVKNVFLKGLSREKHLNLRKRGQESRCIVFYMSTFSTKRSAGFNNAFPLCYTRKYSPEKQI
ncbi:hypothetical protein MJG53_008478 [Ovis ammon polii x Ovis aries]|uniref:Uncharacterized protein n=1 Tax=Ovis ammon polii x Ovis aries TaxID=2918886 RepID=A0ACB9V043_9CETA|nr:hypothetical protein MJG53_008478 [Ovis ammon polii x Ovis aries]